MALSFEALENVFTVGNDYGELIGRMVLFLVGFVAWTALVVRAERAIPLVLVTVVGQQVNFSELVGGQVSLLGHLCCEGLNWKV